MYFDSRITWRKHVTYVTYREVHDMPEPYDLYHGSEVGRGKHVLRTIYNFLILPILDYGCVVLGCAPVYVIARLNTIQNKAVRIICGAVRTSSIASMEIACGIMPLSLRRKYLSLRYTYKNI